MSVVTSKEVCNFILDQSNELEEVIAYLNEDYQETVKGLFKSLFSLMRHYAQNKSRVNDLINILEELVKKKKTNELTIITMEIIELNNKLSHLKAKDRSKICKPSTRLQSIFNDINNQVNLNSKNKVIKYLEYLIFQEKNLPMIETLLKRQSKILDSNNQAGDNIFSILLKRYTNPYETNEANTDYLFHVILLFMKSDYGKQIKKEKEKYYKIIAKSQNTDQAKLEKINELFGEEHSISLQEIENRYNIYFNFPNNVLKESQTFSYQKEDRVDYTSQNCLTIDGVGTECYDDALYIEKNPDGTYNLYIHIIDIPSFIPYGSLVNQEASKRVETLYLRDRNILLYPEIICNNTCSLLATQTRNTITDIFKLDPNFNLIENEYQVTKGIISVKHQLTYAEADIRINNPEENELDEQLLMLDRFAYQSRKRNKKKEKYRQYENFIKQEEHHESLQIDHSSSANIIHEAMVLANYCKAKYFKKLSLPYIYRQLKLPSSDFIEKQFQKIKELNKKIYQDKGFLNELKDSYIRSSYSEIPAYHNGLKLECYSHSSSPARRYADSYCQYLIYEFLFNQNTSDQNIYAKEVEIKQLVKYLNEKKISNEQFESHYNYLSAKKLIKTK